MEREGVWRGGDGRMLVLIFICEMYGDLRNVQWWCVGGTPVLYTSLSCNPCPRYLTHAASIDPVLDIKKSILITNQQK